MKIAYDFQRELNIDLVDYASGERAWTEFYEFLQELPEHGKFKSAMALDMDFAKAQKARLDEMREEEEDFDFEESDVIEKDKTLVSPEGFSPERLLLMIIEERLQAATSVALGAAGMKNPPQVRFNQRPFVALQLLELEEERDGIMELKAEFGIR